jgi:hypothetical protein
VFLSVVELIASSSLMSNSARVMDAIETATSRSPGFCRVTKQFLWTGYASRNGFVRRWTGGKDVIGALMISVILEM